MKTKIEKYCNKIQKETERILYKMFGEKDSIKNYLMVKKELKDKLENETGKPIKEISINDFNNNTFQYTLLKYKTLEKILNIYTESACLSLSNMEDR